MREEYQEIESSLEDSQNEEMLTLSDSDQEVEPNLIFDGLILQFIPRDGDCLFHAIGMHLGEQARDLRTRVGNHLRENQAYFRHFIETDYDLYVEDIMDAKWGGDIEIEAIHRFTQNPIVVLRSDAQPVIFNDFDIHDEAPIFVYFDGVNHYEGFVLEENINPRDIFVRIQVAIDEGQDVIYERGQAQFNENPPLHENIGLNDEGTLNLAPLVNKLFDSIKKGDAEWLSALLQPDYEKQLEFKLNKLGFELFIFEKERRLLDFRRRTYGDWIEIYEEQRGLRRQFNLRQCLSAEDLNQACFYALTQNKEESRASFSDLMHDRSARLYMPDGEIVWNNTPEAKEAYGAFLDGLYDEIEQHLRKDLASIIRNREGSFTAIITSLQNYKNAALRQSENILENGKISRNEDLGSAIDERDAQIRSRYDRLLDLLEEEQAEILLNEVLNEAVDCVDVDDELLSPVVKSLLKDSSFNPSLLDCNGRSLLHTAVNESQEDLVQLLLEYGANPFLPDVSGISALKLVISKGETAILHRMLAFIQSKPHFDGIEREGDFTIISFNPSLPFYDMPALDQLKQRGTYQRDLASELWHAFIKVKSELDRATGGYLDSTKGFLQRMFGTSIPEGIIERLERSAEFYEKLYISYKDNDAETFRQYSVHADSPSNSKFFTGFKKFMNDLAYNTKLLNKGFGELSHAEKEEMKSEIVHLKTQILEKNEDINILTQENHELREEIAVKDAGLVERNEQINTLIGEIAGLTELNHSLAEQHQNVVVLNQDLREKNLALTEQNQNVVGLNQELRQEHQNVVVLNQNLREENLNLTEQNQNVVRLNQNLREENHNVVVLNEKLTESNVDLNNRLNRLEGMLTQLLEEKDDQAQPRNDNARKGPGMF